MERERQILRLENKVKHFNDNMKYKNDVIKKPMRYFHELMSGNCSKMQW